VNTLVSEELLVSCAETALEVMFFTASVAPAESFEQMPRDCIRARVDFLSRPSGYLEVAIGREAARHLAANLAGIELDEVAVEQTEQTVCELANIVCGFVLSKSEEERGFKLLEPRLVSSAVDESGNAPAALVRRRIETEYGSIFLAISLPA
jgi:CheY-specific phosphatase CheX